MNQTELIRKAAKRDEQDFSYRVMALALDALVNTIKETVLSGHEVFIRDFGTFYLNLRSGRTGRNINTGSTVAIPPRYLPAFKPGKEFRDAAEHKHIPERMLEDIDCDRTDTHSKRTDGKSKTHKRGQN